MYSNYIKIHSSMYVDLGISFELRNKSYSLSIFY
jgi:hypothetical protein